ncbi:MAG: TonB-dependent receptor [Blastocatellia bacterium]|nr:TonB-dependent receptor [Blastocatellia bacterium]
MVRFNDTKSDSDTLGAGGILGSVVSGVRQNLSGTLQHSAVLATGLLNEARLGFNRTKAVDQPSANSLFLGNPQVNGEIGLLVVPGLSTVGIPSFLNQANFQNNFQASNDLSWTRGRHQFKFGTSFRRVHVNGGNLDNSLRGQLTFLNVTDFLAGKPLSYVRNQGNPLIGLRRSEWHSYAQDDWKPAANLTFSLGVRYEINTAPREAANRLPGKYLLPTDFNNLAPRLGVAWQFSPKSVLRAGYGVYFNVVEMTFLGLTRFNPPLLQNFTAFRPQFPNLLGNAQAGIPSGLVIPNPETSTPYAQHVNLTLERELFSPNSVLSVAYVGTFGRKLSRTRRTNGGENLPQAQRPDPALGVVNLLETSANSSYHALQVSWSQRFTEGLHLRAAYTFSKFLDDVSDIASSNTNIARNVLPVDETSLAADRAVSDFDLPQILTLTGIWRVPRFGSNRWLNGWSLTSLVTMQSGRPYSLFSNTFNPTGTNNNRINDRPGTLVRNSGAFIPIRLAPGITPDQLRPVAGKIGTLGRNSERGAAFYDWNFSLAKDFPIHEGLTFQVRGELYNAFNLTNFSAVDNVLGSPTFGRHTAASDPRRAQIAVRIVF